MAAGAAIAGIAAAPALGAPEKDTFTLDCDNGNTYLVTVNGNGDWTPARDTASTAVLVPISFGEFNGTATYPDGTTETFTDPPTFKGQSGKNAKNTVNCTFSFSGEDEGVTFEVSGSVTGYVTPRGRA